MTFLDSFNSPLMADQNYLSNHFISMSLDGTYVQGKELCAQSSRVLLKTTGELPHFQQ